MVSARTAAKNRVTAVKPTLKDSWNEQFQNEAGRVLLQLLQPTSVVKEDTGVSTLCSEFPNADLTNKSIH